MSVNLIVVAATLLMAAFGFAWLRWPQCRIWIEGPKFPPTRWDLVPTEEKSEEPT